jgi:hypothetical protein
MMGITAYEDTFKSKNTYKNIFTGINKEVLLNLDTLNKVKSSLSQFI